MTLTKHQPQPRGHYDTDKMARICTTWTRTEQVCEHCGSVIMRGTADGTPDRFQCSGCATGYVEEVP